MYLELIQTESRKNSYLPSKNLWVGNLPEGIDSSEVRRLFAGEGLAVDDVILYPTRGYAYVLFKHLEDAMAAKNALQNAVVGDIKIKIEFDHEVTSLKALVGFKFMPNDEELLTHFLAGKFYGIPTPSPMDNIIPAYDLYGNTEPWKIWKKHRGDLLDRCEDLYFFTKLTRRYTDGPMINRRVGSGTWKAQTSGQSLRCRTESGMEISGIIKRFTYEGRVREQEGRWIMHEYSIETDYRQNDDVLCRIRKKRGAEVEEAIEETERSKRVVGERQQQGKTESRVHHFL